MHERLSLWASIAEIASSIAVVVTLIVLVLGVRENSEIVRVSVYSDLVRDINSVISDAYRDPELNRIWLGVTRGNIEGFNESDAGRASVMITALFRNYEKAYFSNSYGVIGDSEWLRFEQAVCAMYSNASAVSKTHGTILIQENLSFTADFRAYLSETCDA